MTGAATPASRLRQPPPAHRRATSAGPAEPLAEGVSLFGAIGFATLGVSLFLEINYSEHSAEDR